MARTTAQVVAAELRRRLPGLPVKKLHKLLYYCQGHHLVVFDEPLFAETLSAWDTGPVVGQLWYTEREHGMAELEPNSDEAVLNTVGHVVSRYGRLTGNELERLTQTESPWLEADAHRLPKQSARIPVESIAEYFSQANREEDDDLLPVDSEELRRLLADAETRRDEPAHPDSIDRLRSRIRA